MKSTPNVSEWLSWLGRVRFLAITFLVGIVIAARHLTPMPVPVRSFVQLIALWYTLAIFYVILRRWVPQARWHAPLQIACDLLLVTGVVYSTGMQDSYFVSLYLLAILMASVLFSRRGVFLVAGFALRSSGRRARAHPLRRASAHRELHAHAARCSIPGWPAISSRFLPSLTSAACSRKRCARKASNSKPRAKSSKTCKPLIRTSSNPCAAACSRPTWKAASW